MDKIIKNIWQNGLSENIFIGRKALFHKRRLQLQWGILLRRAAPHLSLRHSRRIAAL
jgi:hypothetical protein